MSATRPFLTARCAIGFGLIGATSAHGATPADACALLTPAQVSAVLGVSAPGKHPTASLTSMCLWTPPTSPPGERAVTVTVGKADMYATMRGIMEQGAKEANGNNAGGMSVVNVTGLGDDAYFQSSGRQTKLHVKKGNSEITVEVLVRDFSVEKSQAMEKQLATAMLANL